MPRRTRALLVTLLLLVGVYLSVEVDWAGWVNFYRGYRQTQAIMEPVRKDETLLQDLKARFGNSVGFSYGVSFDDAGAVTRTWTVTRECGAMDNTAFMLDVTRWAHERGIDWPDKVEYSYSCTLTKPVSLGVGPARFGQALDRHLREDAGCADAGLGVYSPGKLFGVQSLFVPHGTADMQLYVGDSGDIEKVRVVAWDQFTDKDQQIHAMLCTAQALMRTVQPEENTQALRTEMEHVWHMGQDEVTADVGPYQVIAKGKPMEMTLQPKP